MGSRFNFYEPTQAEIRKETARIRETWDDRMEMIRRDINPLGEVEIHIVKDPGLTTLGKEYR